MASSELQLSAQLHFLTDAAHLLARSAPETAAYLMSRRNEHMVENEHEVSDMQRQLVCSCCGNIMVHGQTSSLKLDTRTSSRRKKPQTNLSRQASHQRSSPTRSGGPSKHLTCTRCGRFTRITFAAPGPISRSKKPDEIRPSRTQTPSSHQQAEPTKASANASSKKRAKNRKAGLQALLSQSQATSSRAALSLADFMKK